MCDRRLGVLQAEKLRSCKFSSSMKTPYDIASLFTGFYGCGMIEGSFGRTETSLSDFSFLLNYCTVGGS